VVILRAFDPGQALRVIGDPAQGITHFFAVPAPYQFMVQHPDFATTDLSRLRSAGVGGAPCALSILQAWADRGVRLMQGWLFAKAAFNSIATVDPLAWPDPSRVLPPRRRASDQLPPS